MTKEEYAYIEDTIRELSLYVRNCRIAEERENRKKMFTVVTDSFMAPMRPYDVLKLDSKRENLNTSEIFTEKEIKKMPKLKELSYRYRMIDGIHEFRYRRNGLEKSFASKDFKTAKKKALAFCRELNAQESNYNSPSLIFNDVAEQYMQDVKRKNVTEKTFMVDYNRFKNYVIPTFKGIKLKDVKAPFIQKFLNGVIDKGLNRTAEGIYYTLKTILDYAVNTDLIDKNPLLAVKIPLHDRQIGKALDLDVERDFVRSIKNTKYELTFLVLLYTGCRPCELESIAFIKDGFVTFRNRKQKNGAVVFKEIPITPMLAPYVERIKKDLPLKQTTELTKIFAKFVSGYRMYDLRHTFATRCQTCGVPQHVVARWLGHKSDKITDNTYTHFPTEFMLEMAKKVVY